MKLYLDHNGNLVMGAIVEVSNDEKKGRLASSEEQFCKEQIICAIIALDLDTLQRMGMVKINREEKVTKYDFTIRGKLNLSDEKG